MQKDSVYLAVNLAEGAVASPEIVEVVKQVGAQCNAVACMAESIARVHHDYAALFHAGQGSVMLDVVGKRTAELMEQLGDILNNMDAVTDEDDWMTPVFERAQEMWPRKNEPATQAQPDGLKLVPIEPTVTMLAAMNAAFTWQLAEDGTTPAYYGPKEDRFADHKDAYRAMLAKAGAA